MSWDSAAVSRLGDMVTEALELGDMTVARHRIPQGFDSAPHYRGLPDDMCPCEHWVYLVSGELRYRFAAGETLRVAAGNVAHVRAGHLAEVLIDSVLIELTRSSEYRQKAAYLADAAERGSDPGIGS
jgi:uncharacterized cupin superfamily protein